MPGFRTRFTWPAVSDTDPPDDGVVFIGYSSGNGPQVHVIGFRNYPAGESLALIALED